MKKLKSFRSYFKEYGTLNPSHPIGGNSSGSGMGQYVPTADLNLRAQKKKNPRIPRKKGQPAGSDKHSDLYTDENPRGTIHGLGFKDVETARASVKKIEGSGKKHAHKIQAAIAMEQRAKEMGKTAEAAIYRAYIEKMKKKTKEMQKEDFLITEKFGVIANQTKLSELIFRGSHKAKEGKEVDNMYIPMSSSLFKRVFPKQVRVRTFHVTSPDGFERLYDIQNSSKSISTFANMSSRNISGGIAEGSGVVAEIDGNALVSSAQDLFSVPIKDGRRLISYGWLRGKWGERNLDKIDKDMTVLLKALIRKYAPERAKNRTSPYFTDFEVWKSVRASYEHYKHGSDKKLQREAGKKMQKIIKDYLDGVERVLKKNAKQVQHILTNYLKTRRTEDNWDEIIVDDVNILKVFIISDHEETKIFKKDQLDHEAYKKMLDYTKLPVKIVSSIEMERYVLGVAEKESKLMKEDIDKEFMTFGMTRKKANSKLYSKYFFTFTYKDKKFKISVTDYYRFQDTGGFRTDEYIRKKLGIKRNNIKYRTTENPHGKLPNVGSGDIVLIGREYYYIDRQTNHRDGNVSFEGISLKTYREALKSARAGGTGVFRYEKTIDLYGEVDKIIRKDSNEFKKIVGKELFEERNYKKEYANYQGKPEQIARRSSRNKARRLMSDKDIKGKDIGHKDNNPLNNDPKNLKIEDPSKNRREPRLREKFTQSDVVGLEKFADRLLKKYKIDIEFTRHFVDRLNDPRNDPEIKVAELQRLFKKIKKNKCLGISSSPDIEAVLQDMETNLNLPVVIKKKGNEFQVLNKTIMRKPNFKTTSKVIRYEKAPDTSDAMKRYKAGKAGFTDIAHLKAKGLIARSDGEKKKSAKYK